eukprot:scaffold31252_cov63-Phaeocystis_antarctica.AAC.13
MWATPAPRRSPPPWRRPAAAQAPHSAPNRHRRRGAGGPRAGLAAAARAGVSRSPVQPVRRRGPHRPRGTAAAGRCAADDDWSADEAQDARPVLHPGHRRRLRHPRRCARQRCAAGARGALSGSHP